MNSPARKAHDDKISSLAIEYAHQGFTVTKEPSSAEMPFDLGDYRPDLIARNVGGGLIVEVKTRASTIAVDRFQALAQEVSEHPGWRFLLVTLDDVDTAKIPTTSSELPSWDQLADKMHQTKELIAKDALEPAILYLWSIFESALRRRAIALSIPVERLPASVLLNHMYSQGEISVHEISLFRDFMLKRNRIAHGAAEVIDATLATTIFSSVDRLLAEWGHESLVRSNLQE